MDNNKVLVAMSGGVDSSVSVKLLLEQGYDVSGATMHLFPINKDIAKKSKTCCSLRDIEDARFVARRLGIEFYVFDFESDFKAFVIDNFINTYLEGATPNPCIECNKHLKFDSFLCQADDMGFKYIATGHYVTKEYDSVKKRWLLKRSPDRRKDQSYVLYAMTQEQLERTLFPVGEMTKDTIREIAEQSGLINAEKPDSQDICFIPDGDYADFIVKNTHKPANGDIVLTDGTKLGEHSGLINYTVGQRKGLGVSYSQPLYVVEKDMDNNRLVLGTQDKLFSTELIASDVNFIAFDKLEGDLSCTAQTRYHQQDSECIISPLPDGNVLVRFKQPHKAVSKGQAVVFYDGEYVLGGGTIK